jgi:hypothetical protein
LSVLSFVFAHAQDGGEKVAFCTFDTDEGDVQGKTYSAIEVSTVNTNQDLKESSFRLTNNRQIQNRLNCRDSGDPLRS